MTAVSDSEKWQTSKIRAHRAAEVALLDHGADKTEARRALWCKARHDTAFAEDLLRLACSNVVDSASPMASGSFRVSGLAALEIGFDLVTALRVALLKMDGDVTVRGEAASLSRMFLAAECAFMDLHASDTHVLALKPRTLPAQIDGLDEGELAGIGELRRWASGAIDDIRKIILKLP